MSDLREFVRPDARPLPVIVLADVSGSMAADGKIESLNRSLDAMIRSFAAEAEGVAEIHVAVIGFADRAELVVPLQPAKSVALKALSAGGRTAMGAALSITADLVENQEVLPRRSYRPTIVLVSDGAPTDDVTGPIARFQGGTRASKADRMALAIGADADEMMLRKFVNASDGQVYRAQDAANIRSFFKFVTMSVSTRTRSVDPNLLPALPSPGDLDLL